MNNKIFITGARGLLGTAIVKLLSKNDNVDLLCPKRDELDLLDAENVTRFIETHKPSTVIHLASLVFGIGGNLKNQMTSLSANTRINENLFTALYNCPPKKIFFAGTVAGYSHPYKSMPIKEDTFFDGLPHGGEFGYAMAKRHAIAYLEILANEQKVDVIYGALTNLFGPNDNFDIENGHVIPSLVAKAHRAKVDHTPLNVWGSGEATRDFLFVEDAASAILHLLENGSKERLVNISSGVGVSIGQVAKIIADCYELAELHFDETKPTGIAERVIDNSRLKETGFSSFSDLQTCLKITCDWYAENAEHARGSDTKSK